MEKELAQSDLPSKRKVPKTIRSTIRGSFGWCFGDGQLLDSSCIVEALFCQLDKTCLEDPLYKLSSSQMLNKIMLYLILTMHHLSDGFPFLPHYLEKDIMKNEHQRDHKMLLGYKIQSQKPEMEVALYLCFTKTREILGNGKSIPDAREISRCRGFCTSGIPAGPNSATRPTNGGPPNVLTI